MSTDAIVVLREEHKEIKRLFRRFEKAEDPSEQQTLVGQIIDLLKSHTRIENEIMYPRVRTMVPDLTDDILESYEEHHVADLLIAELAEMNPDDERFKAKTTVLIESVEHHIEEEEDAWFPSVREEVGRKELREIGAEMIAMRDQPARKKMPAQSTKRTPAQSGSRAGLKAPKSVVSALSNGDPGLGGSMTEVGDSVEEPATSGARTQPRAGSPR
jgi:hemerythrin-like domain-containing protein